MAFRDLGGGFEIRDGVPASGTVFQDPKGVIEPGTVLESLERYYRASDIFAEAAKISERLKKRC